MRRFCSDHDFPLPCPVCASIDDARAEERKRLEDEISGALDHLERIAFSIPPVNPYTPQIVEVIYALRSCLRAKAEKE